MTLFHNLKEIVQKLTLASILPTTVPPPVGGLCRHLVLRFLALDVLMARLARAGAGGELLGDTESYRSVTASDNILLTGG